MGPPTEAIEACKGKAEGTEVDFTNRRGDKVTATCRMMPVSEGSEGLRGMKGRMAQELNLSDSQKEKIEALLKAEQKKSAPLRKQIDENREQLRKASLATPFNETMVRTLATKLAQFKTDMMISHARVKSEISALLTPEQRAQAEKFQPPMGPRHGQQAGPRCGWDD
jgi:Spy/CpxP family protein refolding chaperone